MADLPSDDQITEFKDKGVTVLRGVFADWVEVLRAGVDANIADCLLYTSPSPRDGLLSRMPSSA